MHLGDLSQPLLLFGGSYSNLHALLALKKYAEKNNFDPKNIFCTGDIVAYCSQPYETVEVIHAWNINVLMGNCEESLAFDANDCGCGFDRDSACSLLSNQWFQFSQKNITQKQRDWFKSLPRKITFDYCHKKVRLVHGSATSINQFLFESDHDFLFDKQFKQTNADIIIARHSGIPFSKKLKGKTWHNTGVIGMPANDGLSNTWFSVISHRNNKIIIESIPLYYNHKNTINDMHAAGLSSPYITSLATGLWPSMDVLPDIEKSRQGIPIKPHKIEC